jgi:3-hydroxy acid dehydrogenase / malonic semialdehyde reductase
LQKALLGVIILPMKKNKIIVTGASRGMGLAISKKLLGMSYDVVGISRKSNPDLNSNKNFTSIELDLSKLDQLPQALKFLAKEHQDISGIVSNAGRGHFGNLEEFSFSEIRKLMDLNFHSHAFLVKAFLPTLKKQKYGNLIFLGSEAALSGKKRGSLYCATKFAIRGFSQALRAECSSSNVRVCLINPGMTQTDFFQDLPFSPGEEPDQHILPEDVAEAVAMVLNARPGTVFDEINLSPQKKVLRFSGGN